MVLAMANVLKMPIVIFSSLENFPTIPILPRQQLHGLLSLFISFNAAGCGHYDYVCRENYLSEAEEKIGEEIKKKEKRAKVFCSCGVSREGQGSVANICNNVIGSYSSRCKCLKARVSCSGSCTCRGCSNPFGQRQSESANIECGAPRKRRKYDFQNLKKHTSQAYLHMKGELPREGALTREEFFVVKELIQLSLASGKELNTSSLLTHYNLVQSIGCTLAPKPLLLRKKSHEKIKRAIAAHDHDAAIMAAEEEYC